jgi:anti-anti-sigma regulatory factor
MLRITEILEDHDIVRLRLDGTISAKSYKDFADMLAVHQRTSEKTIVIDLAGVGFMDDEPARQMAAMEGVRMRIINCSPFIETLLTTCADQPAVNETLPKNDIAQKD